MKTIKIIWLAVLFAITSNLNAQTTKTNVTLTIKGVKEVKGDIMIAFGDFKAPQTMVYAIVPVLDKNQIVYTLENVPTGIGNLYVYQDLNGNKQLDKDENKIPVEPCFNKENVNIRDGENKINVSLINVKEMMTTK